MSQETKNGSIQTLLENFTDSEVDGITARLEQAFKQRVINNNYQRWKEAGISKLFFDATLEGYDLTHYEENSKAYQYIVDYCKNIKNRIEDGRGVILIGPVGIGKTHLTSCIVKEAIRNDIQSKMISSSELIDFLKACIDDPDLKFQFDCPLLVVDDFLSDRRTEWSRDRIYNHVIDYRYKNKLGLILTSRLTLKDIQVDFNSAGNIPLGNTALSRLIDMCDVFAMSGPDYRVLRAKQRMKK